MLDDRVRSVIARLEAENGAVARARGKFLFALVAPQTDCEVLEIGAGRGYATLWLAAGVRYLGGRVLSLERDHRCIADWRRNVGEAGLAETAELVEGDAVETLPMIDDVFDVVSLPGGNEQSERLLALARERVEPGALVVAHDTVAAYSRVRQNDPTLLSVTVPLERRLELSVVLR